MSLVNVTIPHNGVNYSVSLPPQKVEEISSDPEKYDELLLTILKKESEDMDDGSNLEEPSQAQSPSESLNDNKVLFNNPVKRQPPTTSKWSHESIKLMLDLRLGREKDFSKPTCKKSQLWQEISEQMQLIGEYTISAADCDIKYRNLLQTYRINKEKQLKSDEAKIAWPYFDMFDDVLGHKTSSRASKDLLRRTLSKSSILASLELSALVDDDDGELPSKRTKYDRIPRKHSQSGNELTLEQYLFLKNEREEKQWQEKKKLKLLEVQAINNLAAAIKSIGEL